MLLLHNIYGVPVPCQAVIYGLHMHSLIKMLTTRPRGRYPHWPYFSEAIETHRVKSFTQAFTVSVCESWGSNPRAQPPEPTPLTGTPNYL